MIARIGILITILISGVMLVINSMQVWVGYILIGIAIVGFVVLMIGSSFKRDKIYKVSYKRFGEMIIFDLSLWRRILLLKLAPKLGQIRATVKYRYEDEEYWTFEADCKWKDTGGFLTSVNNVGVRELELWEWHNGEPFPLGDVSRRPLWGNITIKLNLIRQEGERTIGDFEIPLKIERGHLTNKGFLLD